MQPDEASPYCAVESREARSCLLGRHLAPTATMTRCGFPGNHLLAPSTSAGIKSSRTVAAQTPRSSDEWPLGTGTSCRVCRSLSTLRYYTQTYRLARAKPDRAPKRPTPYRTSGRKQKQHSICLSGCDNGVFAARPALHKIASLILSSFGIFFSLLGP